MRENLPLILAGCSLLMLGWWIVSNKKAGGAHVSVIPPSSSGAGSRVWMLIQGSDGPEFVSVSYDDRRHGYELRGSFFPREFCRSMNNGLVVLATHMLMPSDGNTAHAGDYDEVVPVEQPAWCATWVDYDRARRRLNWDAVWSRGDGSMTGLKNAAYALMAVCLLLGVFKVWGLGGQVARLNDNTVVLSGQLARYAEGDTAPVKGAVNKAEGSLVPAPAPAGE